MLTLIGLGNPNKYRRTWHNLGKEFCIYLIKFLSQNYSCQEAVHPDFNEYQCIINGIKINILIPTQIYMNQLGIKLYKYLKQKTHHSIILVHDDLSIPLGEVKLTSKANKNHNGVKSFLDLNLKHNFLFLRIGAYANDRQIQGIPRRELVLKKIPKQKLAIIHQAFSHAYTNILWPIITKPDLILRGYLQNKK